MADEEFGFSSMCLSVSVLSESDGSAGIFDDLLL